jgi:hypothetical protein
MKYLAGAAAVLVACTLVTGTAQAGGRFLGNVTLKQGFYQVHYPSKGRVKSDWLGAAARLCKQRWGNTRNLSLNKFWTSRYYDPTAMTAEGEKLRKLGRPHAWEIHSNWNCYT